MANLALFDFDGTITNSDCFSAFALSLLGTPRRQMGRLFASPLYAGYQLGLLSGTRLRRQVIRKVFTGLKASFVQSRGEQFASRYIPTVIQPFAAERLALHKANNDHIVIVSASLASYLRPWCRQHGFECISNELEILEGTCTGYLQFPDCAGEEKARRVLARYSLDNYPHIYAYGDTAEDQPMLALGHTRFMDQQLLTPDS